MKSYVKHYREHFECKQQEFADKVGISVSHLSLIENDKRLPSLELAYRIAHEFDLHIEDIWAK